MLTFFTITMFADVNPNWWKTINNCNPNALPFGNIEGHHEKSPVVVTARQP